MKTKLVSAQAKQIGRKIDRIRRQTEQHFALLRWENGVLRKTLQAAVELLSDPAWKPTRRGDKTKLSWVKRVARIHSAPEPTDD